MILTRRLSSRGGGGGGGLWFIPPPPAFSYSGRNISLFRGKVVILVLAPPSPLGLLHSPFLCENPGYAPARDNTLSWNRNRKVA